MGNPLVPHPPGMIFQRSYSGIKSHNTLRFTIRFRFFGPWVTQDYFSLKFDGNLVPFDNFLDSSTEVTNECAEAPGLSATHIRITGQIPHSINTLTLQIINNVNNPSAGKSLGFRDIFLFFTNTMTPVTLEICGWGDRMLISRKCACAPGTYDDSGTCKICHSSCTNCFGGSDTQCSRCAAGYKYNGTHCLLCSTSYASCFGVGVDNCNSCMAGYFFMDNMCVSTCNSPLIQVNSKTCASPCQPAEFIASDGQCLTRCDSPLQSRIKHAIWKEVLQLTLHK